MTKKAPKYHRARCRVCGAPILMRKNNIRHYNIKHGHYGFSMACLSKSKRLTETNILNPVCSKDPEHKTGWNIKKQDVAPNGAYKYKFCDCLEPEDSITLLTKEKP